MEEEDDRYRRADGKVRLHTAQKTVNSASKARYVAGRSKAAADHLQDTAPQLRDRDGRVGSCYLSARTGKSTAGKVSVVGGCRYLILLKQQKPVHRREH